MDNLVKNQMNEANNYNHRILSIEFLLHNYIDIP